MLSHRKSWLNKLSRSLFGRTRPIYPVERRRTRPSVELLEDRITPTTWTVADPGAGAGSASDITLPYAVASAVNGDTINFNLPSGTTITTSTLTLNQSVTITGPGSANLSISGNYSNQVFSIGAGVTATISGLTIEDGLAQYGAGIANAGTLTLSNDAISNNGGVGNTTVTYGAGIYNTGTLTVENSTINGNVSWTDGGGIWSSGTATLSNDTICQNQGYTTGGGIANSGTMSLTNCTVANNTGYQGVSNPGGITNTGTLTLDNTIVNGNVGGDVNGSHTGSYNLIGTATGLSSTLAYNNNAPTQTLALSFGSNAVATGDPTQAGTVSQNGLTRPAAPDIGAYQSNFAPIVTVNTANLQSNVTAMVIYGSYFSTTAANDSVTFDNGVTGTVTSATSTSLTVSLSGLSRVAPGTPLDASVTTPIGSSGALVQVANVVAPSAYTYAESLDGSGNLTISQENVGNNDNLSFSLASGVYTLTDTGGLLFDSPSGANSGFITGGTTSTITIPSADVNSITVTLGTGVGASGTDIFTSTGTDAAAAPLSVDTGTAVGDQANITGATLDSGAVSLTSTTIGIDASISTAGGQTYTGPVTLGADATLADTANGNIDFSSTVNGGHNLSVNTAGATTFAGAVGGATALTSLTATASGTTAINGGAVTTTGAQTYNNPVTIGANTVTSGSSVTFASTVDGVVSLTVNATGNTDFGGDVGGTLRLASLTVNTATMTAGNISSAGNVTVNDSGSASITGTVASGTLSSDLLDGDFTTPAQGSGYAYNPTGSAWTFTGHSVLQGNGSAWGYPTTPGGSQSAGLQSQGPGDSAAISQTFNWPAGIDTISFYLARRPGYGTLPVSVQVDGTQIDMVSDSVSSSWTEYTTTVVSNGGSHTLTFSDGGANTGGDEDSGLWGVSVVSIGSGTLVKQGAGALSLTGSSTIAATVAAGTLGGSGTIGAVTDNATVNPGLSVAASTLNTGNLSFGAGAVFSVDLNGATPGTYDQLNVTGSINLTGATLTGTLGYTPAIGDSYTIIHNVNNTPIIGTFTGLPAGALATIGGVTFSVNYFGGAGNDVVLTRINTPPTYGESLDGSGNLAIIMEAPTANATLSFSLASGVYTFTDTTGLLFDVNPTGTGAGFISGGGTDSISIPSSDVTSITVTLGTGTNDFTISGTDAAVAPLTVNAGATAGDQVNIPGALLDSGSLSLTANSIALGGGSISTAGSETYTGAVTLSAATTLTDTANGAITFGSTVNGAFALTVNTAGVTSFDGAVGGATALTSLTTDAAGSTTIAGAAITTTGAQTYNDPVTIGANTAATGSSVAFAATVDGPGALTVNATGNTTFSADVGDTAQLASLTVNTATMTAGNITAGSVTVNDSGAASITGTISSATIVPSGLLDGDFTIPSHSAGFYAYYNGANQPAGSPWTWSGSGAILQASPSGWGYPIPPSGIQTAGLQNSGSSISQTFDWPAGTDTITYYLAQRPGYGNLPINVQVDGTTIDTETDTVSTSWTEYTTTFNAGAGGSHTLAFMSGPGNAGDSDAGIWGVSVTGVAFGSLTKQGAGALSLTGTSAAAATVTAGTLGGTGTIGAVTDNATINPGLGVAASTLNTGNLSFGAGGVFSVDLNGAASGSYDQLNVTGSINLTGATLTGTLGYTPVLGDSYTIIHNVNNTPIVGTFTGLPEGALATIGGLTFSVSYHGGAGNDVVLTRTNTEVPTYGESLDGSGNLAITMEIPIASSTLSFSLVSGVYTFTDTTGLLFDSPTGAGASFISGAGTDSITIPSSDVTSITVTLGTGANAFTITGTDASAAPLSVNTGSNTADSISITGNTSVSGDLALTSGGLGDFNANIINVGGQLISTGGFHWTSDETITAGSGITFGSTADGAYNVTLDSNGPISLGGDIGDTTPLTSLTIGGTGTVSLDGNVTTTGAQTFNDPLTLAANTTLTSTGSGNISFGSTVDGAVNLTVNTAGVTTFAGVVGGATALTSLTTDAAGSSAINGGAITTAGSQTYNDAVVLGAAATLTDTANGNITFGSRVNGAFNLTVDTAGVTAFNGVVGGTTALSSLTTDAPGSTTLSAAVTTSGTQTYNDPVTIGANTVTSGSNLTFASTVDGSYTLTANATGNAAFGGAVGGISTLTSLTVDAATMTAGNITTAFGVTVNDSAAASITGTIAGGTVQSGLIDGDFTTPVQTSYTYAPTGSAWTFIGGAILQHNGSAWGYVTTPSGSQSAGLQYNPSQPVTSGSISQTFNWPAGTDTISFYLAQRPGDGILPVTVEVDGSPIDMVSASSTAWTLYTTTFTTTGGSHTLAFTSTTGTTSDSDVGLWGVSVTVAGAGSLLKQGAGTLTITNTSTSSAAATISAGVLEVDGALGNVTIPGGSTGLLSGVGTVGAITDDDATNPGSPASSVGTLNASSANFSGGGNLTVDITGTSPILGSDLLNVSGAVTLGGTSTLTVDLTGLNSTGTFTVVSDGSQTGEFTNVDVVNNPNGYQVTVGYTSNSVTITVGPASSTPISIVSRTVNGDLLNVTSSISSAVEAAGSTTVQITTSAADGLYVGEMVSITGVGTAAFNGTYTVASVIDSTDFTYIDTNFDSSSPGSISNGGSAVNALGGAQRSMVDSITYVFNQAVTLGTGAISMDVNSGYTGTTGVVPTISYATIDDGHTWIVSFSGSSVTGNSIADGVYDITLNASAVTADVGTGTLASSQTDTFFRLFGDSNGDASVTSRPDVQNFAASFGSSNTSTAYLAYFDYNADGSITSRPDVQNFATRFGTSLTGFTPTI